MWVKELSDAQEQQTCTAAIFRLQPKQGSYVCQSSLIRQELIWPPGDHCLLIFTNIASPDTMLLPLWCRHHVPVQLKHASAPCMTICYLCSCDAAGTTF